MPPCDERTQAALAIADLGRELHGRRDTCVLAHHGDDPLWDMLIGTLSTRGFLVDRVRLPGALPSAGLIVHEGPVASQLGVPCLVVDVSDGYGALRCSWV